MLKNKVYTSYSRKFTVYRECQSIILSSLRQAFSSLYLLNSLGSQQCNSPLCQRIALAYRQDLLISIAECSFTSESREISEVILGHNAGDIAYGCFNSTYYRYSGLHCINVQVYTYMYI